jgi:hypothetical protein
MGLIRPKGCMTSPKSRQAASTGVHWLTPLIPASACLLWLVGSCVREVLVVPCHHNYRRRPSDGRSLAPVDASGVRRWNSRSVWYAVFLVVILSLGYALAHGRVNPEPLSPIHLEPSAAIVDQLSLTIPNSTFVQEVTQILNASGYIVDYYPGEKVTVDFYKRLPSMGYDVLILRTHSSAEHANPLNEDVVIFTGEEYSYPRHVEDQYKGRLSRVGYNPEQYKEDGKSWYAIRPSLIKAARGDFEGAIVFMMGCQGMANPTMSTAFLEKGAAL